MTDSPEHFSPDELNPSAEAAQQGGWDAGGARQRVAPGLYVVATPIGNLRDITLRALDILGIADRIYCEDTRVTRRLLSAYGLAQKPIRCDEHTEIQRAAEIIAAIREGQVVAFVSDAGTPGISDPGAKLVAACVAADVAVSPVPGPSAVTALLSASGITRTGQFLFLGFLPPKPGARRKIFQQFQTLDAALVFYEAPQRVADWLDDAEAVLGAREIVIARELTKLHERFYRGTPRALAAAIAHAHFKGEVAIVILPGDADTGWDDTKIDDALHGLLETHSVKEAVALVAAQSGLPRRQVYARALAVTHR